MKNYIHTGLYHLEIHTINFDVAHIYEHLLIETFKRFLEEHGFSQYLFGWVSGETFRDVMFIEYGFYNPAVERLFLKFIQSNQRVDYSLLDNELARVQAEDSSIITTLDRNAVLRQLKQLNHAQFISHQNDLKPAQLGAPTPNIDPEIIVMKRAKKQFREIAVTFGAQNMNLQEMLVFLRLRPLIIDAIDSSLFSLGAYAQDVSLVIGKPTFSGMLVASIYTIRRGNHTSKQIESCIRGGLTSLTSDVRVHPSEIQHYMDGFVSTPNWHTFSIDYYRYTGVLTSKKEIAKVFTPEAVLSLLSRIEVKITTATPNHWDAIQSHS